MALAAELSLDYLPQEQQAAGLQLVLSDDYLKLCDTALNSCIWVDFLSGPLAHRVRFGGGRGQTLAKAVGIKQGQALPSILDTTAGLARDAYVLAHLGCPLTLLERSPVLYRLIDNAIQRAEGDDNFRRIQQQGFQLYNQDGIHFIETTLERFDVIYLDPMYPHRKKSAQVKKDMQILQELIGSNDDTPALLLAARRKAVKRVVVKRPKGGELLAGLKPVFSLESKATRYDIYLPEKN